MVAFSAITVVLSIPACAQTTKAIEYFFDTDPGPGKGTRINLPASQQVDAIVNIGMTSVGFGIHRLYIRAMDNDDQWGLYHTFPVFKTADNQPVVIQKLEYFFDADPGVGKAYSLNLLSAPITDGNITLDMSSVSKGLHQVFIRVMDNGGRWGLYHSYPVINGEGNQPVTVKKLEYFFDTDPGVGNGISIPLAGVSPTDTTITLNLSSLSEGLHQAFIRVMDITGKWSLYNIFPVIKAPGNYQPLVLRRIEFFIDEDPGVDKAIPVALSPTYAIDSTLLLQLPSTNRDTAHLFVRAMDNRGMWGLYHDTTIKITCALYKFKPDFSVVPTNSCVNTQLHFKDSSVAQQWHWKFGNGDSSRLQNPYYTYTTTGNYKVSLFVVTARGCISDTTQKTIQINASPVVDVGPDLQLFAGEQVTLRPVVSGNFLQYQWSPDRYINNIHTQNPVITGTEDILYKLTVTSAYGCSASDSLRVKIGKGIREIKVPNIFTPNGDGINDTWTIQYLDTYPDCRVQVFNRYGQKLFESIGYSVPWDGKYNGHPLPFGTYYYVIYPGKGIRPLIGYVTIIR